MNESSKVPGAQESQQRTGWLGWPARAAVVLLELPLSRRGLYICFFAVAALMLNTAWLRPPLSPDLRGTQISLRMASSAAPEQLLHGPRRLAWDSPGGFLLGLLGVSAIAVLWRPAWFGSLTILVLAAATAGNLTVALARPGLIELMDLEYEQRQAVARVLAEPEQEYLSNIINGRVGRLPTFLKGSEPADPARAWTYLRYGNWLIGWALVGVILGLSGPIRRRGTWAAVGLLLGVGLACLVCWPRIQAEYEWYQARTLLARGDHAAARHAVRRAVAECPEFDHLLRTWLLEGQLDFLEGRTTACERLFRAAQLGSKGEWQQATGVLNDVLKDTRGNDPAVRKQASRLWIRMGAEFYHLDERALSATGGVSPHPGWRLAAAQDAWRRAKETGPVPEGPRLFLGLSHARLEPGRPERVEAEIGALGTGIADVALRADFLTILGDTYFQAGQYAEARRLYAKSYDTLNVTNTVNVRAQTSLGGW